MRKPYPFYSLLSLGGLFLAGSCSIIAEVDRTKIPTDDGSTPEGGQGSGGTSGAGGTKGGTSGAGGNTGGSAGTSGEGGMGGEPAGGTGGAGGDPGGMGGEPGGTGGDGGAPPVPACGDGTIDATEACDDGVTPPGAGDGCSATCQIETGWTCTTANPSVCTPICGDGLDVGSAEVCDDGNSAACGTCAGNAAGTAAGCTFAVTPAAATGAVTPAAADMLDDGATFTINDGYNPAVTFEFDSDDSVTNTATLIAIDYAVTPTPSTNAELQAAIIAAVNSVAGGLLVTASSGTPEPAVTLTHDRATSLGTQPIVRGGTSSGTDVTVAGMTGGLAGNCPAAEECTADADCASLDCNSSNTCTTP